MVKNTTHVSRLAPASTEGFPKHPSWLCTPLAFSSSQTPLPGDPKDSVRVC